MDASVQSGSKCGSDFSIERILGDRKEVREDSLEAPEWLCCTRYRPPKLPRVSVQRSRRAGRHARVPFTAAQAAALEAAYSRAPYLAPPALRALAAALQLRDDRIKIWFQNRRARERREKSTNILPPQGVALPPTSLNGLPSLWTQPDLVTRNSRHYPTQNSNELNRTNENSLNFHSYNIPLNVDNILTKQNQEVNEEDRPDSPLDIETVED